MDALYARVEKLTLKKELGATQDMKFDAMTAKYADAGLSLDTRGYIEEIAVRELEKIFGSAREFNKWYAEISGNKDVRTAFEKFIDFVLDAIESIKKALEYAKMTKEQRAEYKQELAELERIKELYANALRAAENVVTERQQETQNTDNQNLEIKTNEDYTNNVNYALQSEYWHTDLTKTQAINLTETLRRVGNPEATRITDTANWYKGRLNSKDLFVIYSTENLDKPTILYERKGARGSVELDILKKILEVMENGGSINGKSMYVSRVSRGGWLQTLNNSQNNIGNVGSGQNNQNAGVLQSKSQSYGSRAFWSVLENLFREQEQGERVKPNFSLKDADYQKAVDSGDMATAQKMVDEAAKKAGYIGTYYHGSKSDFNVFKKEFGGASNSNAGIGFWFTETEKGAKAWADNSWWGDKEDSKVYKTYLRLNKPKVYETSERYNWKCS